MRTFFRIYPLAAVVALTSFGFACSDGDEKDLELTEKEKTLKTINETYVKETIIPIYKGLADESALLRQAIEDLQNNKTDAKTVAACELWKSARKYWEWSEAFLFGAADEYSIDPHIDTWPLDRTKLETELLTNEQKMANVADAIVNDDKLAGFHGLEYIIFREGATRPASQISENEMRYAVAVARDLELSCYRLEAAWAGMDNVTAAKQTAIKNAGMEPEHNFGERLSDEWDGSVLSGTYQILEGFITIVDEVGGGKIGTSHFGEDEEYIESPHAYNSIQDFEDNITGVKFGYYGAVNASSARTNSVSAFIKSADPAADARIVSALDNCISKIQAMPKPFVLNYTDPRVGEAIDACNDLIEAFTAGKSVLQE
ncbi:MAG: peptidase M75 [Tannerella sp.]|nr:peptidase M75 [Tannerella sp.]